MVFTDEGISTCYDKDGNVIRSATYSVENYTPEYINDWKVGDLVTTSILWPYEINSGGNMPTWFDVVYLTSDKMCLVYPDKGSQGAWGEASFWHFKAK